MMTRKRKKLILVFFWAMAFVWGLTGIYTRFVEGKDLANYGSYVPWGLWVSTYIYFVGLSAGTFLISSLFYVFNWHKLERVARIALFTSLITLIMGLFSIWMDLGHPWRAWELIFRPSFTSVMAWMVWLYLIYLVLIMAKLWLDFRCELACFVDRQGKATWMYRLLTIGQNCPVNSEAMRSCVLENRQWQRILSACGLPLAIAFSSGVGVLFGSLAARPYWHSGLLPVFFLIGALASGSALILVLDGLFDVVPQREKEEVQKILGWIVLGLIIFDLFLEGSEFAISLWYGVGAEIALVKTVLFGEFWYIFWIFHIILGSIIPIILLVEKPGKRWSTVTAGGLVVLTFLSVRVNTVLPGFMTPALKGLERAYTDPRLQFSYVPSLFEWSVVAFIITMGLGLFYLGMRYFPLTLKAGEAEL